ncbi:hypothetical protein NJ959_04070 [Symplocastrum sp. BBK-W-15]|uniref:Uncharacterized protein n=1 Tax=Limnofasciculus baicalensis BBK-W-15 TaxID=2699891 RepID=A0AAE3GPW4_9CYAN|nr:hypothetical protein [Limnofasciculus baicalensis BBK-W-15]
MVLAGSLATWEEMPLTAKLVLATVMNCSNLSWRFWAVDSAARFSLLSQLLVTENVSH